MSNVAKENLPISYPLRLTAPIELIKSFVSVKKVMTEPLFAQLQFLEIRDMHELQLLSFIYDSRGMTVTHFHSYFTSSFEVHGYNTKLASGGDLFLTRKATFQYGIRSIQYSSARLWNSISILIRESPVPENFRD